MRQLTSQQVSDSSFGIRKRYIHHVLCVSLLFSEVLSCSPRNSGYRRRSTKILMPLVYKQHVPNLPENNLGASGPSEGRIRRGDERFKDLVPNYNEDIVWKDNEGSGADRIMTQRCKEKLDLLAISVMNQWPGVRLRVTEGFDEDGYHSRNSLHYSARAVDITTSDRDTSKYGLLARLAVVAGFDYVYYESRSHIHCSVRKEQSLKSKSSGCFHGNASVITRNGTKRMRELEKDDEIASGFDETGSLIYSKIILFLHRDQQMETDFVRLETEEGKILLLTKTHLIFHYANQATEAINTANVKLRRMTTANLKATHAVNVGPENFTHSTPEAIHEVNVEYGDFTHSVPEAIYAADMRPGDFVYIRSLSNGISVSKVTNVTVLRSTGVYAPLTEAGTIIVDELWVSCYAVVGSHNVAHAVFFPVRLIHAMKHLHSYYKTVSGLLSYLRNYAPAWLVNNVIPTTTDVGKRNFHWYPRLLCWIFSPCSVTCD